MKPDRWMGSVCSLVCAIFFLDGAQGQNLVPNPGFEDLEYPCLFGGFSFNSLQGWQYVACAGGPEYFNTCNTDNDNPDKGVPDNLYGHEEPHGGNGYAGGNTYRIGAEWGHDRDYLEIGLTQPLVAGETYCFQMWMSRAEISYYATPHMYARLNAGGGVNCCANQDSGWYATAQIEMNSATVPSEGWALLSGDFVALGGEDNLVIGQFLYNENIDTIPLGATEFPWFAYYYFDDFYLGPCATDGMEQTAAHTLGGLSAYPVPVHLGEELTVSLNGAPESDMQWELVNVLGVVVSSKRSNTAVVSFSTNGLRPGAYMLRAHNGHGVECTRVIIE